MFANKINYRIVNLLALIALIYVFVLTLDTCWGILSKFLSILSPFIIGFAFAYAFTPLVKWIQKKGIGKGLSITIVVLGLVIFIGGILWITLPMLYDQLSLFIKMIAEVANDFMNKSFGLMGRFIVGFVGFIYFLIDMDSIRATLKEWLQSISERAFSYFQLLDGEISNYLKGLEIFMVIKFF